MNKANKSETSKNSTSKQQQILPLMIMELVHIKMGFRSFRSLIAGSLHQVWSAYKLACKMDDFCEGYKIATSKSTTRKHIGNPAPKIALKFIYGDIIPSPTKQGLTTNSTSFCSLFL
eukprot:13121311-Ditylum_brightwellii.AAC.1